MLVTAIFPYSHGNSNLWAQYTQERKKNYGKARLLRTTTQGLRPQLRPKAAAEDTRLRIHLMMVQVVVWLQENGFRGKKKKQKKRLEISTVFLLSSYLSPQKIK